jgi:hypothetical protein
MKTGFLFAAAAAAALVFAAPVAKAKSSKTQHKTHHVQTRAAHHAKHHAARTRILVTRAPVGPERGLRRGYVRGVGEVFFGNGIEGPPNGGAFTYRATNDPSIGYFPSLWAAQRTGDCVIDEGYGRFSYCNN